MAHQSPTFRCFVILDTFQGVLSGLLIDRETRYKYIYNVYEKINLHDQKFELQ